MSISKKIIADDNSVRLNTVSKIIEESVEDYYYRKIKALKVVAEGKNIIAVIDDFNDFSDPCFKDILGVFRKVIFITRNNVKVLNYSAVTISGISDNMTLYSVFENKMRRSLNNEELPFVDNIILKTSAHTLVLELIAKQISYSFLSVKQASELIDKYGFTNIAPEKIEFMRDDIYLYNTLQKILLELFAVNKLSEKQIVILKIISLFGVNGINAKLLQKLCKMPSLDDVNLLIKYGWISSENDAVGLHAVIRETVGGIVISTNAVRAVNTMMRNLYAALNSESNTEYLFKLADRVLRGCVKTPVLCGKAYTRLGYLSLMKAPVDIEDGVLERAEYLVEKSEFLSLREIMDIHTIIIDLHEANPNLDSAATALKRAWLFTKKVSDNFIRAQFFDLIADFYNKRYEHGDVEKCLKYCNKAIYYAKRTNEEGAGELLASRVLFKAVIMMRNHIGASREILSLLNIGGEICGKSEDKFTQVNYELCMSRAWYCALITRDQEQLAQHLRRAYAIVKSIYSSDLGTVVHIILPASRMYYDMLDNEKAAELLNKGAEICRRHEELPYIRQQQEISERLREIYDRS